MSSTTIQALIDSVRAGALGPDPKTLYATGAAWISQSTRFPGSAHTYDNHYLLVRSGAAFGACSLPEGTVASSSAHELAGMSLDALLGDVRLPVRIAALDAYFGVVAPHREAAGALAVPLPVGGPLERAQARDRAIAGLLEIMPGQRVLLIGVVNPLVAAIRERGGECVPCDLNMERTQWGDAVARDMGPLLEEAEMVVATGMTMSNGTFDVIVARARARGIPLVIYAQTGSAIAPQFLGAGVTAVASEPFPFSQFSADATTLYCYQHAQERGR